MTDVVYGLCAGPELVSFLRTRHKKKNSGPSHTEGPGMEEEASSSPGSGHTIAGKGRENSGRVQPPHGWVHMDALEKEKMEWMMDVSRPLSCPALDKVDARFSLEGVVIPRGADLPSHLGLHHHGDEPEVCTD